MDYSKQEGLNMKKYKLIFAIFFIIISLILIVLLKSREDNQDNTSMLNTPINTSLGGHFYLPSTLGKPLDSRELKGQITLMTFGYTNCEDVCPIELMRLHQVIKELGKETKDINVIFVSFDSSHNLDELADYIHKFDSKIIGITGTEQEISNLTKLYGVVYPKGREIDGKASFDHNGFIYLLDQNGRVRAIYPNRTTSSTILKDITSLKENH